MSIENETVEVKLKIPKTIVDFLRKVEDEPLEEYLVHSIVEDVYAALAGDAWGPAYLMKAFNLISTFQKYEVSVDHCYLKELGLEPEEAATQ